MSSPGSQPSVPWWIAADIHTILTYIKVAASDITDSDSIKFIKVDSGGRIEIVNKAYNAETIITSTAVGTGTETEYVDMDNYRQSGFQVEITPGTGTVSLTIYGTMMDLDDETACTYQHITPDIPAPDPITSDIFIADHRGFLSCFRYLKFVFTTVNAANDSAYTVYARELY